MYFDTKIDPKNPSNGADLSLNQLLLAEYQLKLNRNNLKKKSFKNKIQSSTWPQ